MFDWFELYLAYWPIDPFLPALMVALGICNASQFMIGYALDVLHGEP